MIRLFLARPRKRLKKKDAFFALQAKEFYCSFFSFSAVIFFCEPCSFFACPKNEPKKGTPDCFLNGL
jgi:hypothetical protein